MGMRLEKEVKGWWWGREEQGQEQWGDAACVCRDWLGRWWVGEDVEEGQVGHGGCGCKDW